MDSDVAVVGGGVLGVSIADWLKQLYSCSVVLIDKETEVARHTTGRNTGIAHRPYYLDPVKKRVFARSAEKSFHLWKKLAERAGLPWKELGSLMVALDESQARRLEDYMKWGVKNGLEEGGCSLIDAEDLGRLEPSVKVLHAILSRKDASTDYASLTRSIWSEAERLGARFQPGSEVVAISDQRGKVELTFKGGATMDCSLLVNVAGGGALGLAKEVGLGAEYAALHFRGEYWNVDPSRAPPHLEERLLGRTPRRIPVPRPALHNPGRRFKAGWSQRGPGVGA